MPRQVAVATGVAVMTIASLMATTGEAHAVVSKEGTKSCVLNQQVQVHWR